MTRTLNSQSRPASRFTARLLARVWRSQRGAAAIEFVLVVPLMMLVLLGFTELYMYMRTVSNLERTAFTLADSIGQMQTVIDTTATDNSNNLGAIWAAAAILAAPSTLSTKGGVVITSVCDASTSCTTPIATPAQSAGAGTPMITWQRKAPWNTAAMATQETASNILPSTWPFRSGDTAIVVEVFYTYNPFAMTSAFWKNPPGQMTIYERVYVRQRDGQPLLIKAS
ncbi:TadE/TadG family type IV pilus assembly protein [Caballeronia sp. BR00000012568055]|uniref:TadE/TadG family type IV pilus assembly protein n=1 Tax=Caballeronia sp. BR00000012568055 TaxID=2918761 RepID=UPI0023F7DFE0|nr:TadE/TadG family type IV pilus assembly protein [Caballeronia sp. BR00000012568055]